MLTSRERQIYDHLKAEFARAGIAPTFREMKRDLGMCAGTIADALASLERDGLIRRLPCRARAVEVVSRVVFCRFNPITKQLEPWQ